MPILKKMVSIILKILLKLFYSSSKDNKIKTIIIDGMNEVNTKRKNGNQRKNEAYVKLKNPQISLVFSSRTNFTIIDNLNNILIMN